MTPNAWQQLDLDPSELTHRIGSSFIEEFAQGHSVGDVLRELVQNEYDARGDALTVTFGHNGLEIAGTGQPVDRGGWQRLSVVLGTGAVSGENLTVSPKVNGIGSKNFGLRSLYLFGNRIHVRSGGRQTVLDLRHGTLPAPRPDPDSAGSPGVRIFVPWRDEPTDKLQPYSREREAHDFEALALELAPTLMKLATTRGPHGLRSVTVASERLGRNLTWDQRIKALGRHRAGGSKVERTIALSDSSSERKQRIRELEYHRTIEIPTEMGKTAFPSYFRVGPRRIRIGVSLRMRGKRPLLDDRGHFYYPLGAVNALTGCAVSVCAPFEMNSDRKELIDPSGHPWNEWLLEQAATFVMDLVNSEWLGSYEGDAYRVLPTEDAGAFAKLVTTHLSSHVCWPVRGAAGFAAAKDIAVGAEADLDDLLSDECRLDPRMCADDLRALVLRYGAKEFTLAAAIRLRCAGKDGSQLKTHLPEGVSSRYYTSFPAPLRSLERQVNFAKVFDRHTLSASHRSDLQISPTTLTAAGTLAAPSEPLWILDPVLASASLVPPALQLHPALTTHRSIARLCKVFDASDWIVDAAKRASEGRTTDEERGAVYRWILDAPNTVRRAAWTALKRSPMVRDHRGEWAAASELVMLRSTGPLEHAALRIPGAELARRPELIKKLAVRTKLRGTDLLDYAEAVSVDGDLAEAFEDLLFQRQALLTRTVVKALGSIEFLRSSTGGLVAPNEAFIRTPPLVKSIGPDGVFVAGRRTGLYERLGCRVEPTVAAIVAYLDRLREADSRPPHPESLYPALVGALRAEGRAASLAGSSIIFHAGAWHAPRDVLLGRRHRMIFDGVLPVVIETGIDRVYQALGASATPRDHHWRRFLEWLDEQSDSGHRRLPPARQTSVRAAYVQLERLPADIPELSRVLMDTAGRLHSTSDAIAGRFLVDDDPTMAEVIRSRKLPFAFADLTDPSVRGLYLHARASLLTAARRPLAPSIGDERAAPRGVDAPQIIQRLHSDTFTSALHALAAAISDSRPPTLRALRRRLGQISRVRFVTALEERYKLGRYALEVPGDVIVDGDTIVMRYVKRESEVHGLLARAVASRADASPASRRALADAIFRLLSCSTPAEMQWYLAERGIPWNPRSGADSFDDLVEDEDEGAEAINQLADALAGRLREKSRADTPPSRRLDAAMTPRPAPTPQRPALPPLGDVQLAETAPAAWTPHERGTSGGGGGGGGRVRTPEEYERDGALGRRGEQLVFEKERERVQQHGLDPELVVWTSEANPAADHDIRSADPDGSEIWLEVKTTSGRHGRFDWPLAEFELALRKRNRYILCRVYEGGSVTPTLVRQRDPVGKLLAKEMRLDISNLSAEIGGIG